MWVGLRKLTAREHVLSASVLVVVLTMVSADVALPDAARLKAVGHLVTASIFAIFPAFVFVAGLVVLLPRTGNASRHAFFRLVGRLPLSARYLLIAILFCGLATTIKWFEG